MFKKLFSHSIIYGLSPQVPKVAAVLSLPLITQYLTPFDYGVFGIITAYSSSIEIFSTLGLRLILINSFYKYPIRYAMIWRQIYGFLILWMILYAILKAILIYLIIPDEVDDKLLIVFLNVGSVILFGPTGTIGNSLFQVKEFPVKISVRTIVFGLLTVALNVYFIAQLKMGYVGWFYTIFIVSVLTNFSYWVPLFFQYKLTPVFRFSWRRIWNSLKVSLPTVPHYYSSFLLNSSDKIVMEKLSVATDDIGKYNLAYTVGNIFQSVGMASGFAIQPLMMKCYKNNDDESARNLVFLLQALFLMGSFFVCLWLKEIFVFLIRNDSMANLYPLAILIVMGYNYRAFYFGAINKIIYLEKTNVLWRLTLVAGIINVALNIILIPFFGYEIAAVTTFVALMYNGYSGYFSKTFRDNNTTRFYPLAWLFATVLLTIIAYSFREIAVVGKIGLSLLILALSSAVFYSNRGLISKTRNYN